MKDNFSGQAEVYARFRPTYPQELFDLILDQLLKKEQAWDCATGNGQTAIVLAKYFSKVYATDISQQQLNHAHKKDNIIYSRQPAEQTSFEDNSFDLVTVSQALHWLQFDSFYKELVRVSRDGSIFAAWTYSLLSVDKTIDKWVQNFYSQTLKGYWDSERKYVDENYQTIPFPLDEISTPSFSISLNWNLSDFEGYLNSWSAVQQYKRTNGENPVDELINSLKSIWKDETRTVNFPIYLRMGRIVK